MSERNASLPTDPALTASSNEPALHNSVLTRTHEPPRSGNHSWIMVVPLVVAIIAGAGFWVFVQSHPSGPLVNHAVAAAPMKPAWAG